MEVNEVSYWGNCLRGFCALGVVCHALSGCMSLDARYWDVSEDLSWIDASRLILFFDPGWSRIGAMGLDGSNPRWLLTVGSGLGQVQLSRNGSALCYLASRQNLRRQRCGFLDLSSQFSKTLHEECIACEIDPDSRSIAYLHLHGNHAAVSEYDIASGKSGRRAILQIDGHYKYRSNFFSNYEEVRWLRGRHAIVIGSDIQSSDFPLIFVDLESGTVQEGVAPEGLELIVSHNKDFEPGFATHVSVAPDGTGIFSDQENADVHLCTSAGERQGLLKNAMPTFNADFSMGRASNFQWSADSRFVVFNSGDSLFVSAPKRGVSAEIGSGVLPIFIHEPYILSTNEATKVFARPTPLSSHEVPGNCLRK